MMNKLTIFVQNKSKKEDNYMNTLYKIALALGIIGCINWGLVGIFNFNLVDAIFGAMSVISRIIYILVGISGLWAIKLLFDR